MISRSSMEPGGADYGAAWEGGASLPPERITSAGQPVQSVDRAVDHVLRSVPLPAGFMSRIGALVVAMREDGGGSVDSLSC